MIWMFLIIGSIIAFIIFVSINESNRRKEQGIILQFQSTHVYGIPNIKTGDNCEVVLKKDALLFNDTQIIPVDRFQYSEHVIETEMKLTEHQKSVILRALAGGILLGPIGAIVGGISGVGSKKKEEEKEQNYIQISYTNKEGDFIQALFLTKYNQAFCKGLAKKINDETGRTIPNNINESLKEPYEI